MKKLKVIDLGEHKRRPKSYSVKAQIGLNQKDETDLSDLPGRPKDRSECRPPYGLRPCPWVGCRYHLYLDVTARSKSIKIYYPDKEPWELEHTCALDLADKGPMTLNEIADTMNISRERIRQLEAVIFKKLRGVSKLAP